MKRAWPVDPAARSRLIAADLAAFLASGRKIRKLPIGASTIEERVMPGRYGRDCPDRG